MAIKKWDERKPLWTVGIHKAIQWGFAAWNLMPKDIAHMCLPKFGRSLHMLSVIRKTPLCILSGIPDESEAIVLEGDMSSEDEAIEMVKSNLGDKEPDELILDFFCSHTFAIPEQSWSPSGSRNQGEGCSVTRSKDHNLVHSPICVLCLLTDLILRKKNLNLFLRTFQKKSENLYTNSTLFNKVTWSLLYFLPRKNS